MFYQEGKTSSIASGTVVSNSIITCDFDIVLFAKERFICQGFAIGYDIEIIIPIFFIYNKAMFYQEGKTSSIASGTVVSNSIITCDFDIVLFAKEQYLEQ